MTPEHIAPTPSTAPRSPASAHPDAARRGVPRALPLTSSKLRSIPKRPRGGEAEDVMRWLATGQLVGAGEQEWLPPAQRGHRNSGLNKTRSKAQQQEAAMQHLAIDLGGTKSQICVRSAEGQILHEQALETASLGRYLKRQPASRVVLETCSEAFGIADLAASFGHEVRVVPTMLVRSLGVGARRIKTDRRDAQVLSEVSCRIDLPSVHIPTDLARQRRSMCTMREELVTTHTSLINCVRGSRCAGGLEPSARFSAVAARFEQDGTQRPRVSTAPAR